jgi:hypothetical protein
VDGAGNVRTSARIPKADVPEFLASIRRDGDISTPSMRRMLAALPTNAEGLVDWDHFSLALEHADRLRRAAEDAALTRTEFTLALLAVADVAVSHAAWLTARAKLARRRLADRDSVAGDADSGEEGSDDDAAAADDEAPGAVPEYLLNASAAGRFRYLMSRLAPAYSAEFGEALMPVTPPKRPPLFTDVDLPRVEVQLNQVLLRVYHAYAQLAVVGQDQFAALQPPGSAPQLEDAPPADAGGAAGGGAALAHGPTGSVGGGAGPGSTGGPDDGASFWDSVGDRGMTWPQFYVFARELRLVRFLAGGELGAVFHAALRARTTPGEPPLGMALLSPAPHPAPGAAATAGGLLAGSAIWLAPALPQAVAARDMGGHGHADRRASFSADPATVAGPRLSREQFMLAVRALLRAAFIHGQRSVGVVEEDSYDQPLSLETSLTPYGVALRIATWRLSTIWFTYQPPARVGPPWLRARFRVRVRNLPRTTLPPASLAAGAEAGALALRAARGERMSPVQQALAAALQSRSDVALKPPPPATVSNGGIPGAAAPATVTAASPRSALRSPRTPGSRAAGAAAFSFQDELPASAGGRQGTALAGVVRNVKRSDAARRASLLVRDIHAALTDEAAMAAASGDAAGGTAAPPSASDDAGGQAAAASGGTPRAPPHRPGRTLRPASDQAKLAVVPSDAAYYDATAASRAKAKAVQLAARRGGAAPVGERVTADHDRRLRFSPEPPALHQYEASSSGRSPRAGSGHTAATHAAGIARFVSDAALRSMPLDRARTQTKLTAIVSALARQTEALTGLPILVPSDFGTAGAGSTGRKSGRAHPSRLPAAPATQGRTDGVPSALAGAPAAAVSVSLASASPRATAADGTLAGGFKLWSGSQLNGVQAQRERRVYLTGAAQTRRDEDD